MFAALYDTKGSPIDLKRFELVPQDAPTMVRTATPEPYVAFLAGPPLPAVPGESYLKHPAGSPFGLVGRVRLDRRAELRTSLAASDHASDGDLVRLACERWGEASVERMAGDFCFAAIDARRRMLMAARDQLGVRALYYTNLGTTWLISDSLDWLARQRRGDLQLDDYWIADFLTIGFCREHQRTAYRDIHRLPPGHSLRLDNNGLSIRRYWRLDLQEPLYLKRRQEYGERFRGLVRAAIAERLPDGSVGIAMSGGLDSTTLAALAVEQTQDAARVIADCNHFDRLMDIGEDRYARLAAQYIGIHLTVRSFDDLVYDRRWRERGISAAEPTKSLLDAHHLRTIGLDQSRRAHVWFEGEGPDNALTLERGKYLDWLRQRGDWPRFARALLLYARVKGSAGWRQSLHRYLRPAPPMERSPDIPPWIDREFVAELKLTQRIETLGAGGDPSHPWHPEAVSSFTSPIWQNYFCEFDFQDSFAPTTHRHPFLDLRVLQFMLSVPPIPWGWKKQLEREAMRGRLPRDVLTREKTPLSHYPDVAVVRREGLPDLSSGLLRRFVDLSQLPDLSAPETAIHGLFAVHALDYWLTDGGAALRPR